MKNTARAGSLAKKSSYLALARSEMVETPSPSFPELSRFKSAFLDFQYSVFSPTRLHRPLALVHIQSKTNSLLTQNKQHYRSIYLYLFSELDRIVTMMNLSSWSVLLLTVVLSRTAIVSADYWDELCCLCDECDFPASGRENLNVDQFGTTCYDQLLNMADTENSSTNGSAECAKQINLHRDRCCNRNSVVIDIAVAPTPAPQVNLPYGDEPYCDLCEDGRFPGLPRTVTAVLYIQGNPTCELLYYMGRRGLIQGRLCNPIQDYLEAGCGCADAITAQAPVVVAPAPTPTVSTVTVASVPEEPEQLFDRKVPQASSVNKGNYKLAAGRVRGSGNTSPNSRTLIKGSSPDH
jgi:hypothetical protein